MRQMSDQKRKTFIQIDWSEEIKTIGGPYQGNRKIWLAKAAFEAGITLRQGWRLFYRQTKDPKFSVALSVLNAAEKARTEAEALASQFEMAAGVINANGKNKNRNDVLTLLSAARALRGLDTTYNRGASIAIVAEAPLVTGKVSE
jgi:hypothetical protein